MTVPSKWQFFGKHKVRVEEDIVYSVWDGPSSLAEVQEYSAVVARVIAERGRVYCLVDMRNAKSPSAEAREWLTAWTQHHKTDAHAIFGASFTTRSIANLIRRAVRLLKGNDSPMEFFETEAEARAFLDAARAGPTSSRAPRR